MHSVYNTAGEEKVLDFVDAREHVESGRWFFEKPKPEGGEVTFLDEHDEDINPATTETDSETDLGTEELDPTSQEAYDQRQAAFEEAKNVVDEQVAEVEKEIKKSRSKK